MDRLCSMLCSSPMSAYTSVKTDSSERSRAGMWSPAWPMRVKRPTVFRETVLPPVLGPVITRRSKSLPKWMSMGTTFFLSSKGWRPFRIFTNLSSLNRGSVAFMSMASSALAKMKSRRVMSFRSFASSSVWAPAWALKSARIRPISSFSSSSSSLSLLLSSTTAEGSTK